MIPDITRSLDDICITQHPSCPSSKDDFINLLQLIEEEIEECHSEIPETFLSQPSDFRSMTFFFGPLRDFRRLDLISSQAFNVEEWGPSNPIDILNAWGLLHTIISRIIEESEADAKRAELLRAEAAGIINSGPSRIILLSSLPWATRQSASQALQSLNEPGLRQIARRQGCTVHYEFVNKNHVIRIRPMLEIMDRGSLDPIELMRLIAVDKSPK